MRKADMTKNNRTMRVKIKLLHDGAIIPRKATQGSAAYDVYLPCDYQLTPGRNIIPLGISVQLPYGYEAKIEPRSGYSSKGMEAILGHTKYRIDADVIVGKIDSDYTGEIGVIIKSNEPTIRRLWKGQRIAQLTIYKVHDCIFDVVNELDPTERGDGGFGHTGA